MIAAQALALCDVKPADVVAYVSKFMTLMPGDLILTGTPSGVGCFRKPPIFLKGGDTCVVEIDRLGRLTNTVKADPPAASSKRAKL